MFRNPLRTEYEKARADAQEAWKALNDFRTEHGEERIAKDAALFREAKRLHDAYEEACKVAHAAEGRMLDAILTARRRP